MKRRLYYLLPGITATKNIIDELLSIGIDKKFIHALAKPGINIEQSIGPDYSKKNHRTMVLEILMWNSNLAVFFVALLSLIVMLIGWPTPWVIVPILFMIITFVAGAWYAMYVPFVHTNKFRDALSHGEILLILETNQSDANIHALAQRIQHHHPVAVSGGTSWNSTFLHH